MKKILLLLALAANIIPTAAQSESDMEQALRKLYMATVMPKNIQG